MVQPLAHAMGRIRRIEIGGWQWGELLSSFGIKGEGKVLESSFCCGLGREAGRLNVLEAAEECREGSSRYPILLS